ncbi:hypothetical protein LOK49_LG03G00542 [Camellia lanceoleosa]|uniref:Uncharacterized protein n=1 Tax=Camellia lanceoleosa TaxID=1840588 RepID=A0ACC0IBX0_9ERIC|nr:hypothetical protein LOK49_LG03G00542 [Camellia lanceoleosa]
MGVDLATERAGFAEMEDVNFSDSELVCHVRDALRSVTLLCLGPSVELVARLKNVVYYPNYALLSGVML